MDRNKALIALAAYWAKRATGRKSRRLAELDTKDAIGLLVMAGVTPPPLPPNEFGAADRANEFCRSLCDRLGIRPVETSREADNVELWIWRPGRR